MDHSRRPGQDAERIRVDILRRYDILDTGPEEAFDRITRLAARSTGSALAFVCFVDEARQWFKAQFGHAFAETPRKEELCAAALAEDGVLVVPDAAADPRFRDSTMVRRPPHIRFYAAAALRNRDGYRLGSICVADAMPRPRPPENLAATLTDLAAVASSELELRSQAVQKEAAERELRAIADALPVQISFVDAGLVYRFINQRYIDWYGRGDIVGRHMRNVIGEKAFAVAEPNLWRALKGEEVTYENAVTGVDGVTRHVLVNLVPRRTDSLVDGLYLAAVDISRQKESEETLSLLNAELDHRLKNTLATVQAMIAQAAREPDGKDGLAAGLFARLGAMARAHDIIHQAQAGGLDLRAIFENHLQPFAQERMNRIAIQGPPVILKTNAALAMATAVNELVSNSARFGSLSSGDGEVAVGWRLSDGPSPRLELTWKERGGPPVDAPIRKGYGASAIERLLAYDIGARSSLAFEPDGVRWSLNAPLMRIGSRAAGRPVEDAAARRGDAHASAGAAGARSLVQGLRVLIAEDSAHIAFGLEVSLRAEGAVVIGPVASVAEARRLASKEALDAAVVDVNLHDEMSFPLIEDLLGRGVKVIVSTGYDLDRQFPGRASGATVLRKPFTTPQLLRALTAPAAGG